MFGVGLAELAVIAVVAVIVVGPDKVPELAKQAAQLIKQFRAFSQATRDNLRTELGPEFADLELRDLDPRELVRKHILDAMEDDDTPPRPAQVALRAGELPPYDVEAT